MPLAMAITGMEPLKKLILIGPVLCEISSGQDADLLITQWFSQSVLFSKYRQKALVSFNKASVTLYCLAEEEHKISSMALADSLGLGVSHADRKLCRQQTQGKPWGFFKAHCSKHLLQSSVKS